MLIYNMIKGLNKTKGVSQIGPWGLVLDPKEIID